MGTSSYIQLMLRHGEYSALPTQPAVVKLQTTHTLLPPPFPLSQHYHLQYRIVQSFATRCALGSSIISTVEYRPHIQQRRHILSRYRYI
jgi:hypothetical protein